MSEHLKALTLDGVWPWAITVLDKAVENRSPRFAKSIAKQIGGGWLAIHAGKNIGNRPGRPATNEAIRGLLAMALDAGWEGGPTIYNKGGRRVGFQESDVRTSAIVAVCRVGRVLPPGESAPWKVTESAAVELLDVRVLPEPVPCKGKQGLWRLDAETHAAVVAQGVLGA